MLAATVDLHLLSIRGDHLWENRMAGHWSMIIIYVRDDRSIPSNETEDEEVEEDIYYHDHWESYKIYQWNNQRKRKSTVYLALHVSYIMEEKMMSYIFPRVILGNVYHNMFTFKSLEPGYPIFGFWNESAISFTSNFQQIVSKKQIIPQDMFQKRSKLFTLFLGYLEDPWIDRSILQ